MRFIKIILIFVFIGAGINAQINQGIQNIINEVNLTTLNNFVNDLSGEMPVTINGRVCNITSRHSNYADNDTAAQYIKSKLEGYGLTVYEQVFDGNGKNIFAAQTGTVYPERQYIICAHYDNMPRNSNAPGADDNASGVAAVLEAARILTGKESHYTIIYAFWDKEEQGLIGSDYYAEIADDNNDQIEGVINLDMIAFDSDNDMEFDLHTKNVANSLTLSSTMQNINTLYNIGLTIDVINPGANYSDHSSFWDYGFSAILMIEDDWDFNDDYHTSYDLIDNFNSTYFLKCSRLAIATLASLAEAGDAVPVELISFEYRTADNRVELYWSTASELNNYGFSVERSTENKSWKELGFIKGEGNSTEYRRYQFNDHKPVTGKSFYRLIQKDFDGNFEIFGPLEINNRYSEKFVLLQNHPNPFNPSTTINFNLPIDSFVDLTIYDLLGEVVSKLLNQNLNAGYHEIIFNSDKYDLTSGIYIYVLRTGNYIETKKMVLSK